MSPFEVALEGIEARVPQPAVWRQPGVELGQRSGVDLVHPPLRVRSDADQPGLAQYPQVLGGAGLGQAELAHELVDGPWPLAQQLDRRAAVRVRESEPRRCHIRNITDLAF